MKKIRIFIISIATLITIGLHAQPKNLTGVLAIDGTLTQSYENIEANTPVTVRGVFYLKHNNQSPENHYVIALDINCKQIPLPTYLSKYIEFNPKTENEFWQSVCIKHGIYEYFHQKGYQYKMRKELDKESLDYLDKLSKIEYNDAYISEYVESIFAKTNVFKIFPNRPEKLNIRVIQSPDPDAYMLPNGSMLISTGLLGVLDSEEELLAIISNETAHYLLDHQLYNVVKAEKRAKRAIFWSNALADVADVASDVAWRNDNPKAWGVSLAASIGSAIALVNAQTVNRLGMFYSPSQEYDADRIAKKFLKLKGMNPDALSSALTKIHRFYMGENRYNGLTRYGSCNELNKRIESLGKGENLVSHSYLKATSDVVTFNAAMYQSAKNYELAKRFTSKNITNNLASSHDYVILTKAKMAQENTEESNNECLELLQKAKELSSPTNIDLHKQEILLLLRMKKQVRANELLKEYQAMLAQYKKQTDISPKDIEWISEEEGWAENMISKINLL